MADLTGPISTLPGSVQFAPEDIECDYHPDRKAVRRIQGETDSFGAEFYDLCQECIDEHRKHQKEARTGSCEWCKEDATDLRAHRDIEEGSYGCVYRVCGDCIKKEREQWAEEDRENHGLY